MPKERFRQEQKELHQGDTLRNKPFGAAPGQVCASTGHAIKEAKITDPPFLQTFTGGKMIFVAMQKSPSTAEQDRRRGLKLKTAFPSMRQIDGTAALDYAASSKENPFRYSVSGMAGTTG